MSDLGFSADFLRESQAHPVEWIKKVLGIELTTIQCEIAEAIRDHPKVAVRSCHASGKTFEAASLALWFAYSFPGSMTITTAPGFRQVKENLWGEIAKAYSGSKAPLGGHLTYKSCKLELGPRWGIIGFATDQVERFSGYHAPSMFVIVDEASGVDEGIFEGIEGARSAGLTVRMLLLSQMTRTSGTFYNAFNRDRGYWNTFTIAAQDTPNFSKDQIQAWREANSPREGFRWSHPFLINPAWAEEMRTTWGEESDLYRVRVLGLEPKGEATAVIPLYMVEAAIARTIFVPKDGQTWMGLDVARQGDDDSYMFIRRGPLVLLADSRNGYATQETVGWAMAAARAHGVTDINVDDIGVGAGVTDLLFEECASVGITVHPVNFGSRPRDTEHFANRRAEDYMGLRQRFETGEISLMYLSTEEQDRLVPELTGLRWKPPTPAGKMQLEAKDEFRKRLRSSPDAADALCLAFAMPDDELTIFSSKSDTDITGFFAD